jgi:predicted ester cyclase
LTIRPLRCRPGRCADAGGDVVSLEAIYRGYLACLNAQDWQNLRQFVGETARRNGEFLGLAGYRVMLEADFRAIPDLAFVIERLAVDAPHVAARLRFDCSPRGVFLGLPVNGRRVSFAENVFYRFDEGKIIEVWSVIDKAAIEAQLGGPA